MSSASAAKQTIKRERFASPISLLAFTFSVLVVLVLFFPKRDLIYNAINVKNPSYLTMDYLRAIVNVNPDDPELRLSLARSELQIGDYQQAKQNLQLVLQRQQRDQFYWQARFISYELHLKQLYAIPVASKQREQARKELLTELTALKGATLTPMQYAKLADQAVSLGDKQLAKNFYMHIPTDKHAYDMEAFALAARVALSISDYQISQLLYFRASHLAHTTNVKRKYFILAVNALLAADQPVQALQAAEANLGELDKDRASLTFLTHVALAANKPAIAQTYVKQALQLP